MGTYYIHQSLLYWKERLVWLHLNKAHKKWDIVEAKENIHHISKRLSIPKYRITQNIKFLEDHLPWSLS